MSQQIRQALERERHHATLWRELRPEEAAKSDVRAYELEAELGAAFKEELEILKAHEAATRPATVEPSCVVPMGMDENLVSLRGRRCLYDEQTLTYRPV